MIASTLAALAVLIAAQATPPELMLTLDVEAPTGRVMVALYDSEAAYSSQGAPLAQTIVDVAAGERVAAFPGLKPGAYAARMFHDVDGDGEMATNPFGMPLEPYAFTNNARGNMGPASWDRAHVAVSEAVAQTIVLK